MAWLWYFFIGLILYLTHLPFQKKNRRVRFCIFLGSGFLVAVPALFLGAKNVASGFHLPDWMVLLTGVLSGAMLFWAEEKKWFERFWLRFFITLILGMALTCALLCAFAAFSAMNNSFEVIQQKPFLVFFTFFLMGLLTAFGYTLPERWFAKKE